MPARPIHALLVAVIAVVSLACPGRTASNGATGLIDIDSESKLRVGYIVFPPTVFKDPKTQELTGHSVATIREIARLSGLQLDFIETDWASFAAGLQARRFDVSIAPTFATIPRAKAVAFTRPLFFAGNSAIVRRGETRFGSIEDFNRAGVKIAVTQGEAGHEYARANLPLAQLIEHRGSDQSIAFQQVVVGRADAALGDAYMTAQFAKVHPEVVDLFAQDPYNLTPVAWAVRHEDYQLLTFLNAGIETLDFQGKLREYERAAGANWLHLRKEWTFTAATR